MALRNGYITMFIVAYFKNMPCYKFDKYRYGLTLEMLIRNKIDLHNFIMQIATKSKRKLF